MSHRIVFRHFAVRIPCDAFPEIAIGCYRRHQDALLLLEEGGDNNVIRADGRVARSWSLIAAGDEWEVMREVVPLAASCEGGCLKLRGRDTRAETYISAARRTLAAAVPGAAAARAGVSLQARMRLSNAAVARIPIYDRELFDLLAGHSPRESVEGDDPGTIYAFDLLRAADLQLFLCVRQLDALGADGTTRAQVAIWNQVAPIVPHSVCDGPGLLCLSA